MSLRCGVFGQQALKSSGIPPFHPPSAVDRTATPWVIVIFHTPLYNNYVSHFKEGDTFRTVYEPIFLQFQVDLVYSGHIHAYERTHPVYNYERNDCAPMYVTIGESRVRRCWLVAVATWASGCVSALHLILCP